MESKYIIAFCWGFFLVVWLVAAIFTKRASYREPSSQRFRYSIMLVIGCFLLFRTHRGVDPLDLQIIPPSPTVLLVADILCICGLAFCFWARAVLGRNWSGTVTLKEDHELIVTGPYRFVRHPIYTGLVAMFVATAMLHGHLAAIIGLVLIIISLWIKLSAEEELMVKQFPDQYAAYQERTKGLIPFVL